MSAPDGYRVRLENLRAALRSMRRDMSAYADCPRCAETAEEIDRLLEEDEMAAKLGVV